jgi:hypothetical protein
MTDKIRLRSNYVDGMIKITGLIAFLFIALKSEGLLSIILWILAIYLFVLIVNFALKVILKKPYATVENNIVKVYNVFNINTINLDGLTVRRIKANFIHFLILRNSSKNITFSNFEFRKEDLLHLEEYIISFNENSKSKRRRV